jgi:hypothetical protein
MGKGDFVQLAARCLVISMKMGKGQQRIEAVNFSAVFNILTLDY